MEKEEQSDEYRIKIEKKNDKDDRRESASIPVFNEEI